MKPTIKINISGVIFHIDEDAYARLREYLTEINSRFTSHEEGKEIIADIEARIAELLQSRVSESKEVINTADIDEVIRIMGKPEDYFDAAGPSATEEKETTRVYTRQRRLYRDPDNSVIGGVCGGLGAYFGIDPVWIRLAFALMLVLRGFGLLLYIILWIVLPKARTTAQKLEMKGEAVNVSNIERSVKEEYEKVKEGVGNIPRSEAYRQTRDGLTSFMQGLGQVIVALLKGILAIIGFAFLVAGITALVAFLGVLLYSHEWFPFYNWDLPPFSFREFMGIFIDPVNLPMIQVCLALAVGIPLVALIYGGIKLLFNIRTRDRILGLTAFILWLISTITLVSIGVMEGRNFRTDSRVSQTATLEVTPGDTLYISLRTREDMGIDDNEIWLFDPDDEEVAFLVSEQTLFIRPDLDIRPASNGKAELELRREARGYTREQASRNAENIKYSWTLEGNRLVFDPLFTPGSREKFRAQELDLRLRIPEGTVIYLEEGMGDFLRYAENDQDWWSWRLTEKYWTMGREELRLNQ